MTDTLARLARLTELSGRDWLVTSRVAHLDWRPLKAEGRVEQTPALGHVRLTPAGWQQARRSGGGAAWPE